MAATGQRSSHGFVGGGELGELIRTMDWASTPLGAQARWPEPLRTVSNLVVENKLPMAVGWGRDLILLYNDAFRVIAADKHPRALGRPIREVWPESWPTSAATFQAVMERGESVCVEHNHVRVHRRGYEEDACFTICYSPVWLEDGSVGGTLVTLQETTTAAELAHLPLESAALFRAQVEHGPDGLVVHDGSGRILHANARTCSDLGYDREELTRMNVADVEIGFDPTAAQAECREARAGEPVTSLGHHRRRDGTTFPVEVRSACFESHGEARFVRTARDITERQRAEVEREQALAMLESSLSQSPSGILIAEAPDVTIRWSNPAALAIRGESDFPLTGIDVSRHSAHWQTFRPDGSPYPSEDLPLSRAILKGETTRNEEVIIRHASGEDRWVSVNAAPIRNAAGAITFGVVVFHDITERKRAEEALRASEHDLNRAQTVAHTGSWRLDIRRNELLWSAETYRIFGIPNGTPVTYSIFLEHVHPDDREAVDRRWQAALRGEPYEVEHRIVVGDQIKWVRERVELEVDAGGLRGGFGTVQDITETRQLVEALQAANARLSEADRRKNEFLAMLSHELRNPLAPILNSLYILERAAPGGEQARRAQAVVERQVGHMIRLIDDLLDLTRISRGKIQLKRERMDLNEVTKRTVEDYRSVFVTRGVQLDVVPAPAEVWVHGDRTRLAQAIGNLLQNAAKFTEKGGATTVSLGVSSSGTRAVVTVRDTGRGIAPDLQSRLFEAFVQDDTTLDRSKGGLGLGLALVKGLVEMHGGSVTAASEGVGKGSVFTILLPLDISKDGGIVARREVSCAEAPRRILVIEDNVDAADSLREALELGDHVVVVEYSGPKGIERARAERPDVVLCDIGLPGMDGYAVARALRADPALSRMRLVALTGYAGPEDVARSKAAGFDAHLAKPPSIDMLERVLASCSRERSPSPFDRQPAPTT